jgi:hypothetical protein
MHSVAQKYFSLGKFSDALPKFEMFLEYLRRVRSENDPDIGECDVRSYELHLRSHWEGVHAFYLARRLDHGQRCCDVFRPWKAH